MTLAKNDEAMLIARTLVEQHIEHWGYVPHPDFLKEAIAAELRKANGEEAKR
jgi:hypothetical protein